MNGILLSRFGLNTRRVDSSRYSAIAKEPESVQTIADLADQAKFHSPSVIFVGEVVRLGRELHWPSKTEFDCESESMKVLGNSAELRI